METWHKNGRDVSIRVVYVFDVRKILSHAIAASIMEKSLVVYRIVPKMEDEKNAPMMV